MIYHLVISQRHAVNKMNFIESFPKRAINEMNFIVSFPKAYFKRGEFSLSQFPKYVINEVIFHKVIFLSML